MVDRRQVKERYDPWSFTTKAVEYARNSDVHTISRILHSAAFEDAPASRKFILLKAIVKDFSDVRGACALLQRYVFNRSVSSTAMLRPDIVDSKNTTLAHWAAQNPNPTPILQTLRELGSPMKSVNKAGMSPLHYLFWESPSDNYAADDYRLREAARFLKSVGCIVDLRDQIGETVFHVACLRKNPLSAFHVLKDLGANLHMKTKKNESALHLVATSCDPTFLTNAFEFLINEGIEGNARDDSGKTALYYISERKKIDPELRSQLIALIRPVAALNHHHFAGSDVNSDTDSLLSPQTSSGFSEKLSLDDLPGTPESGSAFRHFAVPDGATRHAANTTNTTNARFSPYEPRRLARQHRSSTQDLYSLSTSSYSPGGDLAVTSPVHAFVPIQPHSPATANTTSSSTRSSSGSSNSNLASTSSAAATAALHQPPPPPTPHAQHDAQTSTDDIQAQRSMPVTPPASVHLVAHREPMSPRCRLWRMGELENALPGLVSSDHGQDGRCSCTRCQREAHDRTRLAELERTVKDLTRQNADMRQQFDELHSQNQTIRERAQRIDHCGVCRFRYNDDDGSGNNVSRCTFRKCGHICCATCVAEQLTAAQNSEDGEQARCPFCRLVFEREDVVKLQL